THAYWNFLLKRSGGTQLVVGLSKVAEVVMFAPVFLVVVAPNVSQYDGLLGLAVVGATFVAINYVCLAWAYSHGDLSFVYPIARGGILLFLPALAYLTIGERVNSVGLVALAIIVVGIVALQLPALEWRALSTLLEQLRSPATAFALLAALAAACYTLWDKRAVQRVPAFAYIYAYTTMTAAAYAAFIWRRHPREEIAGQWRLHRSAILQVGFFNITSYLLVLIALRTGTSSYVIALRQFSIAIGVMLGAWLLREHISTPKRMGVALIVLGCVLVGFAR
ncbi:MAG TPA: EamA family transporter, partial [Gemmatimonadaceae bacterium]|nr:EamA family transporter [Gemmatimonadaceae bacterium]